MKSDFQDSTKYPEPEITSKLIGFAFEIFNELRYGLPERVYQKAYAGILEDNKITFNREKYGRIIFRGKTVGKYFVDFLIDDKIAVEMKVRNDIYEKDVQQLLGYLTSENIKIGLIFAFAKDGVKIKRLIQ